MKREIGIDSSGERRPEKSKAEASEKHDGSAKAELDPRTWLDAHGDYLHRYAMSMLGNRADAEEMVQDTFLSGIRALDSFEGRGSVRAWLRSILRNKVLDRLRAKKRLDVLGVEGDANDPDYFNSIGIWKTLINKWDVDAEAVLHQRDFLSALSDCFSGLPEKMRVVLTMKIFDGFSSDQICNVLEISSSNLWVIVHRARIRLRDCLNRSWYLADNNS